MKTIKFKCTLLTDVIINQRAATEGNQESLDFIPGNVFLGIAAGTLYFDAKNPKEKQLTNLAECQTVFHSGKVRFGDAHPEKNGKRSLRIPASMYKPKLENKKGLYIHHAIIDSDKKEFKEFQPKQCRTGFYYFENEMGFEVRIHKTFAIKSAYDRDKRRSKDQMMYGYESLLPQSTWLFEVAMDDDVFDIFKSPVINALCGEKRIGRSRTAQYGLVKIEEMPDADTKTEINKFEGKEFILVYADGRLIFLDQFGLPTFQPKAEDLNFKGGEIDWEKSQVRTFQYAPWNFKRQVRDTDRCGVEKGSVFYIRKKTDVQKMAYNGNGYVGTYQNEGFGKIIINPDFLRAKEDLVSNGLAAYQLESAKKEKTEKDGNIIHDDFLFKYLKEKERYIRQRSEIYEQVNKFVKDNSSKFQGESFASQWGNIRLIAMQYKTKTAIETELFTKTEGEGINTQHIAYLTHGVASEKWSEQGRIGIFKRFFNTLTEENAQLTITNLAAEMAKACSNN